MPEGDAIHRAAKALRALEGDVVSAVSPHPRAAVLGVAERIDGKRLEKVEAVGKNLLLSFEDGTVVRSHLRMNGRWRVEPAGRPILGKPWLVLRGESWQAVQRHGPVLELGRGTALLGPDVMASPPDLAGMLARFRAADQSRAVGEALIDQRLVAGIGNMWKAEALFGAGVSPWVPLGELSDERLLAVLSEAAELMQAPSRPRGRSAYRRAGRPCPRCGTAIRSWPQGDDARMAYWCPSCQEGTEPRGA